MTCSRPPALTDDVQQGMCGAGIHDQHGVVHGPVGLDVAHIGAPRIPGQVRRGIPSAVGEIHATAERHSAVDHHNLLMKRGPERAIRIIVNPDTRVGLPTAVRAHRAFPSTTKHQRIVPGENENLQPPVTPEQKMQKVAQEIGHSAQIQMQSGLSMEIPTDQHDGRPGPERRMPECPKISFTIDQQ